MNIVRARVQNFRSIKDTNWVNINDDITTFIGPNESGKTSFLQAISGYNDSEGYSSRDIREPRDPFNSLPTPISALELSISEANKQSLEYNEIKIPDNGKICVRKYSDGERRIVSSENLKETGTGFYNPDYIKSLLESVQNVLDEIEINHKELPKEPIKKTRDSIQQFQNSTEEVDVDQLETIHQYLSEVFATLPFGGYMEAIDRVVAEIGSEIREISGQGTPARELFSYLPSFVYHDSANLLSDKIGINEVESNEHRTFRNLLDICGVDYNSFKEKSKRERSRSTKEIETTIQGKVNELWEQKSVDVVVDYDAGEFIVSIRDTEVNGSNDLNRGLVAPSQRSRGFQWFFSFYINIRANAKKEKNNTIMLLDDPAVFLHPEGKRNWLDAIEEIVQGNQVLYTSHSPFLIRKEFPSRIRVVEDQNGTVINDDFLNSNDMSLEPLRKALGIGLGDSPFVAKRKILVEGPSDYYILTGLANYFKQYLDRDIINWDEVTIFPVGGADNMVQASKWVMSEEFSYAILLDNDGKGNDVKSRLQDEAPAVEQERVFQLERNDDYQNFHIEIEDMFRTEFYIDCLNTAYEAEVADFDPIEISELEDEGGVSIEGETYKQRKIASKLNNVLEDQGHGELDKSLVAREIQDRLTGGDADEEDVEQFNLVMDKLRRTMPR